MGEEAEVAQMMALLYNNTRKTYRKKPTPKINMPAIIIKQEVDEPNITSPKINMPTIIIQQEVDELKMEVLVEEEEEDEDDDDDDDDDDDWNCDLCGKVLKNRESFVDHMELHCIENTEHPCQYCDKIFTQKNRLLNHMVTHSGERKFICEICGQTYRQSSGLRRHKLGHLPDQHQCEICGKRVTHPTRLALHMRMHQERKYQCHQCGKLFTQKSHLNTHMVVHTGHKRFKCEDCEKEFAHKSTLEAHTVTHTGKKKYVCQYCSKRFSQRGGLTSHVNSHLGIKKHQCSVCQRRFTQKGALKIHMAVHNGFRFECRECSRQFKYRNTLRAHILAHHDVKDAKSLMVPNLKIKELSDTGVLVQTSNKKKKCVAKTASLNPDDQTFCCGQCGHSFRSLVELGEHLDNVSPDHFIKTIDEEILSENPDDFTLCRRGGGKSHECDKCGKLFSYKSTLSTHQKVVHSAVKQFQCLQCPKAFARKSYLDVHMVVHTGERKFKCEECGKTFTQKGSLNNHAATHMVMDIILDSAVNTDSFVHIDPNTHTEPLLVHTDSTTQIDTNAHTDPLHADPTTHTDPPTQADSIAHIDLKMYVKCNECGAMFNSSSDLSQHKKDNHDVRIELLEQDFFATHIKEEDEEEDLCILVEIDSIDDIMP